MHKNNLTAKTRVATFAADGDAASALPPIQTIGGFACLRSSVGNGAVQGDFKLVSVRARVMAGYGYRNFAYEFGEKVFAVVVLRATDDQVVDVRSLAAYPERVGSGRRVMELLCGLADQMGVTLWLDACPFGPETHIPIKKLKAFYGRFGFFRVPRVNSGWINGYHRWEHEDFRNPMIRNPQQVTSQSEDQPAGATGHVADLVHA